MTGQGEMSLMNRVECPPVHPEDLAGFVSSRSVQGNQSLISPLPYTTNFRVVSSSNPMGP